MPLINKNNDMAIYGWTIICVVAIIIISIVDGKFRWDFLGFVAGAWVLNVVVSWLSRGIK